MPLINKVTSRIKRYACSAIAISLVSCATLTSCNAAIWEGVAMGLTGFADPTYGSYGYSDYTSSAYIPSSSSNSSSSTKTCRKCGGSGACQTCGGSGKVYDYGTTSIISKSKYEHSCGVCHGRKKCGVCNGKGAM